MCFVLHMHINKYVIVAIFTHFLTPGEMLYMYLYVYVWNMFYMYMYS